MKVVQIWIVLSLVSFIAVSVAVAACQQDCCETTKTCFMSEGNPCVTLGEYNPAVADVMWTTNGMGGAPDNDFSGQARWTTEWGANAKCPCESEATRGDLVEGNVGASGDWEAVTYTQYCNHCKT